MRYRTILVANDGQAHSRRAMRRAGELARESRAELHVVLVPEPEPNVAMLRAGDYAEATRAEREAEVRGQLRELTAGTRRSPSFPTSSPSDPGTARPPGGSPSGSTRI